MRETSSSKTVNASQAKVDGHQVDTINPRPNPPVHTIEQVGGSEDIDCLILGNHDKIHGEQEISINLKAWSFRPGRFERHRLTPRRALPRPCRELRKPCHVIQSPLLTSPSFVGHSSKPTPSAVGFCRRQSASHRRPPRVLDRCRCSVLECHHDAPVPTSPTTSSTRRSFGLASVTPSVEPPPPPRALFGEPLLPKMPQSGYPRCCVTLAAVPDPPH
jgi:hypothetical protein